MTWVDPVGRHPGVIKIGSTSATTALRKQPDRVLIEIGKRVGFRLFTMFGSYGVIDPQ